MSSYSYQDLKSRLDELEKQLDFVTNFFVVTRQERSILDPRQVIETKCTLAEVYRQIRAAGPLIDVQPLPDSGLSTDEQPDKDSQELLVTELS